MRVGVDTGGTFTDVVTDEGQVVKVISSPAEPDRAVGDAIRRVAATRRPALLAHGTTVATNALLEGRGAPVARAAPPGASALLRPACRDYLRRLAGLADEVLVMTSAGGLIAVDAAADLPATLLLSGPAGGVRAAAAVAAACGYPDAVSFDMGGTSTDVCLVRGGVPDPAPARAVAGYPIRLPALDVHTIGAGGRSLAHTHAGGPPP